ncbi:hypothetical protein [Dyella nitratireducens]|uniref:hypothetical protein n=1 Tax=Dyella nitratireducens TaxID=1849580 RepID=UPI001669D6BD|nr:hypothetical protein [Dyella nitratireducens]
MNQLTAHAQGGEKLPWQVSMHRATLLARLRKIRGNLPHVENMPCSLEVIQNAQRIHNFSELNVVYI